MLSQTTETPNEDIEYITFIKLLIFILYYKTILKFH